jgi:hypothetical protein
MESIAKPEQERAAVDFIINANGAIRDVAVIAHMLHKILDPAGPLEDEDREALGYLASDLSDRAKKLDEHFHKMCTASGFKS